MQKRSTALRGRLRTVALLGFGLGLMTTSPIAPVTAHDKNASHQIPGLSPLAEDRQISFHKHWMLGCGTDVLLGVDRCKAQTFDYGVRKAGKTAILHTLELTHAAEEIKGTKFNLRFRPAHHELNFNEKLGLSFDFGETVWLEPLRQFRAGGLISEAAVINLQSTPVDLVQAMAEANNVRVFYKDQSNQTQTVQLSLLGFNAARAALERHETAPPSSDALVAARLARQQMSGEWTSDKRTLTIGATTLNRRDDLTTYYYRHNPTGAGAIYGTIAHGKTSRNDILQLLKVTKFNTRKARTVVNKIFAAETQYPATWAHYSGGITLTGQIEKNLAIALTLKPSDHMTLYSLTRSKNGEVEMREMLGHDSAALQAPDS